MKYRSLLILLVSAFWLPDLMSAGEVDFTGDVLPLLTDHCIDCHGPDEQESKLRLDSMVSSLSGGESGEPAVVPGNSEMSYLVELVTSEDESLRMPPDGESLSEAEIGVLRAWIDDRDAWRSAGETLRSQTVDHWSLKPLVRPVVESPGSTREIDFFIQQKLEASGLAMSDRAERRRLIRRLFLVMHGVAPTPQRVQSFVDDQRPRAWELLVDEVLASPRYGERLAMHWLDLVRFGETHGFETNRERPHAWRYRDWVISAFNSDKPYDDFVIQQIAGDAVGEDVATGFLVAGPYDLVKGKDPKLGLMQRQDELADMINTTGTTFLGLTLGCARCHNHKFDPITQTDFYSLQAIFAGVNHADRKLSETGTLAYAGTFSQPGPTYRLYRGEPGAPREQVSPDAIAAIGQLSLGRDSAEQDRRLALAKWIASPDHPLTARVLVNRLWQFHFGAGIVDTPSDFGGNGTLPTHAGLLDWLAAEFIESGWSIKHMQRLILISNTWQQDSRPNGDAFQVDAASRLLWRFPPRRLEAEGIRDCILAATGKLDLRMGGSGFSAFEVEMENVRHYNPKLNFGPADWRRMIYMTKVRQEKDAVFGVFDCPDGSQVTPKRIRSTTPLQALNLLNSRFVIQQSELFAARLEGAAGSRHDRVQEAYRLCFGREADREEAIGAGEFIEQQGWVQFARAMFNANEFVFIP